MSASGVNVKALDTMPELLDVDHFYLDLYNSCGTDVQRIVQYCELFDLNKSEILEAVDIARKISAEVP